MGFLLGVVVWTFTGTRASWNASTAPWLNGYSGISRHKNLCWCTWDPRHRVSGRGSGWKGSLRSLPPWMERWQGWPASGLEMRLSKTGAAKSLFSGPRSLGGSRGGKTPLQRRCSLSLSAWRAGRRAAQESHWRHMVSSGVPARTLSDQARWACVVLPAWWSCSRFRPRGAPARAYWHSTAPWWDSQTSLRSSSM